MTYRLWLEEHAIASGEGDLRRRVPARGAAQMELLVSADARNLTRTLPRLALTPQPWRYRLEGTVAVLPRVRIAYRHLGEIDLRGLVRLALSLRQRTLPATSRRPDPGAGAGPGPGREPGGDAER
jgi:hypothetical protein